MQFIIEESWFTSGYKRFNQSVLWQGSAHVVYFCPFIETIAQPQMISTGKDGATLINYDRYSNVRFELDKDGSLWARPANTIEELRKLIKDRKEQIKQQEVLAKC